MKLSDGYGVLGIGWFVVVATNLNGQPPAAPGRVPSKVALAADGHNQLIEGVFRSANDEFRFSSRKLVPNRIQFQLSFKDVNFEAEADLDAQTRTIDGKNRALTLDERASLRELTHELERELRPHSQKLDSHIDLAYRAIAYWADAPVGWPLRKRVISRPMERTVAAIEGKVAASTIECPGGEALVTCTSECEVEAGTYISYIADGCKLGWQELWHDATDDDGACLHPYCSEQVQSGCNQSCGCLGRCTSGCGDDGLGAGTYTIDCAAHDRCCRVHGDCTDPFDSECGDEFEDAADDVLFGATNCPDTCAAQCPCDACWSETEYQNNCPIYWCGDGKCDCGCQFEDADCGGPQCAPWCGNGLCDGFENACNCPEDNCPQRCGDGCCNGGENRCTCSGDGCANACGSSATELFTQEDYDWDSLSDELEAELLARHAPILKFEHERLRPTPVWWYLDRITHLRHCPPSGGCTYYQMVPWSQLDGSDASILQSPRPGPFELVSPNIGEGPSWGEVMDYVAAGQAPGLYGRVTPHREFIIIQYFQFFAFNDAGWPFDGGDHEGDWMYLDLYLNKHNLDPKMVVWHHHGDDHIPPSIWVAADTIESGNRLISRLSCPMANDNCQGQSTFYYTCGSWGDFGCEFDEVWANVTYWNGARIPFNHPVVYLEWGTHEFWPIAGGANSPFETLLFGAASIEDHYGNDPHNYGPPQFVPNLGEIERPFPSRSSEHAAIMHYNGQWGDWAGQGFFGLGASSVPYGPAGGQWIRTISGATRSTKVKLFVAGLPQSETVPVKFILTQRVNASLPHSSRCYFVGNGHWKASIFEPVVVGFGPRTDQSCSDNHLEALPAPEYFYLDQNTRLARSFTRLDSTDSFPLSENRVSTITMNLKYFDQEKIRVSFSNGPTGALGKLAYYDRGVKKEDFTFEPNSERELWVDKGSTIRFLKPNWPEDDRHAWRPPPSQPIIRTESGQGVLHWNFFEQYYLDISLLGADDYGYSVSRRASQFGCCSNAWVEGIYSGADWYDTGTEVEFSEWTSGPTRPQKKTDDRRLFRAEPLDAYGQLHRIRYYRREPIGHETVAIPNTFAEAPSGLRYLSDSPKILQLSPPFLSARFYRQSQPPSPYPEGHHKIFTFDALTGSWTERDMPRGLLSGRYFITLESARPWAQSPRLVDLVTQEEVPFPIGVEPFAPYFAFYGKHLIGKVSYDDVHTAWWLIDPPLNESLAEWVQHSLQPVQLPVNCDDSIVIAGDYLACRSHSATVSLVHLQNHQDGRAVLVAEWNDSICPDDSYDSIPSITPEGHCIFRSYSISGDARMRGRWRDEDGVWHVGAWPDYINGLSDFPLVPKLTAISLLDPEAHLTSVGVATLNLPISDAIHLPDDCWDGVPLYGRISISDVPGKGSFNPTCMGTTPCNTSATSVGLRPEFPVTLLTSDMPAIAWLQDYITQEPPWLGGDPEFYEGIATGAIWFADRFGAERIIPRSFWYYNTHDHGRVDSLVMAGDWLAWVDFDGVKVAVPYAAPSITSSGAGRGSNGSILFAKRGKSHLARSAELEVLESVVPDLSWIQKPLLLIKDVTTEADEAGCILLRAELINVSGNSAAAFEWSTPFYGVVGSEFEVCPSETTLVALTARMSSGDEINAFAVVRFEPQEYQLSLMGKDLRNPLRLGMTQSGRSELIELDNIRVTSPDLANEGAQFVSGDLNVTALEPGTWDITVMNPVKNLSDTLQAIIDLPVEEVLDKPQLVEPLNGGTQEPLKVELKWGSVDNAIAYEVWAGLQPNKLSLIAQSSTTSVGLKLRPLTTVYWKVVAVGAEQSSESSVWSFATVAPPPGQVVGMSPSDGGDGVATTATLAWDASSFTESYRVHFGTSEPLSYHGTVSTTSFLVESLLPETTYYWRVDSVARHSITRGVTNHFRTAGILPPVPSASIVFSPLDATAPADLIFELHVPDRIIAGTVWRFGDNKDAVVKDNQVEHRYLFPCNYLVRAMGTTDEGEDFSAVAVVEVAGDNLSDLDQDQVTDLRDFAHFQRLFGACGVPLGDFTGDDCVTLLDFEYFNMGWSLPCIEPGS